MKSESLARTVWHPATSLALALCIALVAFVPWAAMSHGRFAPLFLTLIPGSLAVWAGPPVFARWLRGMAIAWLPLAVSMLLVHGLFYPEGIDVLWSWGWLRVTREGWLFGAGLAARFALAVSGIVLASALHSAADLARGLEQSGLPLRWTYPLRATIGLLPAARRRATAIQDAQAARGLAAGSLFQRVRALPPRIVPFAVGLLSEADVRAQALALRGMDSAVRPTSIAPWTDSSRQRMLRRALIGGGLLVLVLSHALLAGIAVRALSGR